MGKKAHRSDNHLLRLEAKFFARSDEWDEATDATAKTEEFFDRLLHQLEERSRSRIRKAEHEEEGRAAGSLSAVLQDHENPCEEPGRDASQGEGL